ncbi:MAG TPA: hypothetical protein VKG85_03290 [Actinomycetes bacterium]|nr:hypothetical protein [Actinomycetes bacterium]
MTATSRQVSCSAAASNAAAGCGRGPPVALPEVPARQKPVEGHGRNYAGPADGSVTWSL